MVFDYYRRLNRRQKAIYRKSDAIERVELGSGDSFGDLVIALEQALADQDRKATERAAASLVNAMTAALGIVPVGTRVLSARPSSDWGELHGLYEPADEGVSPRLTVWMRTAKHKKVVAFRTFLRTILHEFCHHLDYELLEIEDSFHTEGFFKRESSLFHQLVKNGES
ncbi:MAG: hypothetical protein P8126_10685 [Gammaproteobacteria bacterium]|jgi:hypothetical protein